MCRHLAYLGPPVTLGALVVDPPYGLIRQSFAPRRQRQGLVNADGFGIGWYPDGAAEPARYRRAVPIWADANLADLGRVVRSGAVLAAVRSATAGFPVIESANAPFASGRWLFSHNGKLPGWPACLDSLAAGLTPSALAGVGTLTDSTLLWALVLDRLGQGEDPADALGAVASTAFDVTGGRINLLLTDGHRVAATALGDTLCYRVGGGAVVVASEPYDDEPGWADVPDGSVLLATTEGVRVMALRASSPKPIGAPVTAPGFTVERHLPPDFLDRALRTDALEGLTATPKQLPPKWFYDKHGSALFEEITRLPEYYPTRAERAILEQRADEIAVAADAATVVELGSGSSQKTRLLLDALRRRGTLRRYVPVDVSDAALLDAGPALVRDYPGLEVRALVADFEHHLDVVPDDGERRLVAFLGGTIGNFEPGARAAFLAQVRATMRTGDVLLLGTDLVKSPEILVPAYDDAAGVTAEFNRNVLHVLNRELGADFVVERFAHLARWDALREWIEMHLVSQGSQVVRVEALGIEVHFADGEHLRTEISAKFRREGVEHELAAAGLVPRQWWTDTGGRFAVSLAEPA